MAGLVLDASVTMAWCFEDEEVPVAREALERLEDTEARVPALWALEVANVLLVAERRGRLRVEESERFLELLRGLPIRVMDPSAARIFSGTLSLARRLGLTAYDAAYLDLAIVEGLALATADEKLRAAARTAGVTVL